MHRPHRPPNHDGLGYPNKLFLISYILMGIVIVSQLFYICYLKYSYKNFKEFCVKKGRLLQLIPIVTVSTVASSGTIPVYYPDEYQPSAPTNTYTATDGSRIINNKVAPPVYAP